MTDKSNLDRLKAAYQAWHDTKGDPNVWLDLMDDDFHLESMGGDANAISFAEARNSKQEAVAYFADLTKGWKMISWSPHTFVDDGEAISMFGQCAWMHRTTGKIAEVRIAHLWKFRNGKAVGLTEVFDSFRAVAAATP